MLDFTDILKSYYKNNPDDVPYLFVAAMMLDSIFIYRTYEKFGMSISEWIVFSAEVYAKSLVYHKDETIKRIKEGKYTLPDKKWVEFFNNICKNHPEEARKKYLHNEEKILKYFKELYKEYKNGIIRYYRYGSPIYRSRSNSDDDCFIDDIIDFLF